MNVRRLVGMASVATIGAAVFNGAERLAATALTFVTVAIGVNGPFGIDYSPATGDMLVSVNYATGTGGNFELVSSSGIQVPFSTAAGFPNQIPVAVAKDALGGFMVGEAFSPNGTPKDIVRLDPAGGSFIDPWVVLPGEWGVPRGLYVDRTGLWGGDLIVGTSKGNVWRVNSAGVPTFLTATGVPIDSLLTLPDIPAYGPWAGKIVAAIGPPTCAFKAIDAAGTVTSYPLGLCPKDIDVIQPGEDLYVAVPGSVLVPNSGKILRVDAANFAGMECQLLASQVKGPLGFSRVAWNGSTFDVVGLHAAVNSRFVAFTGARNLCQPEICGDGIDNDGDGEIDEGCVEICGDGLDNDQDGLIDEDCVPVTNAGCTPGYWKNHPTRWMTYLPGDRVDSVFMIPPELAAYADDTLLQALGYLGGSGITGAARILLRASSAALLNSSHVGVGYPMPAAQVIAQVNAALASLNRDHMLALAYVLDAYNNYGCPL